MIDHPSYIRIPTEDEYPYFENKSAAEAVISAVVSAQKQNWLRLHGFVVMPEAIEMVATPIKQGVAGVVGHLEAETIPLLTILLPQAGMVWARKHTTTILKTQRALNARLNMLLLTPVAAGIVEKAEHYPYSSANPRYTHMVSTYAGFLRTGTGMLTETGSNGNQNIEEPEAVASVVKQPEPVKESKD